MVLLFGTFAVALLLYPDLREIYHDKIHGVESLLARLKSQDSRIHKIYTLLPAYNEADALAQLVPRISKQLKGSSRPFEILVVNDGSGDRTTQILHSLAQEHAVRELRHETNRGYGAALNTGFLWVLQKR